MNKETLEEAAKLNYDNKTSMLPVPTSHWINSEFLQIQNFKEGAKWQAERMYSEEEVESLLHKFMQSRHPDWHGYSTSKWFEQFKKKT